MPEARPDVKVELGRIGPGLYETLVDLAQTPTFPFFRIVLEKTNKAQTADLSLSVSPNIYAHLCEIFRTNKILFYLDIPRGGIMQAWTGDMLESIRILTEHKAMSKEDQWVLKARSYISHVLTGSVGPKAGVPYEAEEPLEFLRSLLEVGGLLPKIDSDPKLLAIASDIIGGGKKDFDSCVYRLAMALYHSQRFSGRSAVPEIEDPGATYLSIVSNTAFAKKYPRLLDSIRNWPESRRTDMTKTFICFCVAAYLCHKAAREARE